MLRAQHESFFSQLAELVGKQVKRVLVRSERYKRKFGSRGVQ